MQMKNNMSIGLFLLAASCGAVSASPPIASQTLLCVSTMVIECLPEKGCHQVLPQAIAAPAFIKVDLAEKKVSAVGMGITGKSSDIEHSETIDGKLILQGAEDGVEGVRDGVGWSIAISAATGRMVLTASGEDAAFNIFGNCTAL
jgi:hypothetical protein